MTLMNLTKSEMYKKSLLSHCEFPKLKSSTLTPSKERLLAGCLYTSGVL